MDEYTARRQADADFVHEESMRAEAYAEGTAAERERCAKLCEAARPAGGRQWNEAQAACFEALSHVAAVIRGPNAKLFLIRRISKHYG